MAEPELASGCWAAKEHQMFGQMRKTFMGSLVLRDPVTEMSLGLDGGSKKIFLERLA